MEWPVHARGEIPVRASGQQEMLDVCSEQKKKKQEMVDASVTRQDWCFPAGDHDMGHSSWSTCLHLTILTFVVCHCHVWQPCQLPVPRFFLPLSAYFFLRYSHYTHVNAKSSGGDPSGSPAIPATPPISEPLSQVASHSIIVADLFSPNVFNAFHLIRPSVFCLAAWARLADFDRNVPSSFCSIALSVDHGYNNHNLG